MTVQHGLKIVVFGLAGFAFRRWLPLIAVMIASGFLGTVYGTRLLDRLPEESFRRWFRIGITVLALDLLVARARRGVLAGCSASSPRRSSAARPSRADDQPPPGKQRKAVARDVVEQVAHDDHAPRRRRR